MVESADDILEALGKHYDESKGEVNPYKKGPKLGPEGTNRYRVLSLLSAKPVCINDICDITNLSIPLVCEVLIPEEIDENIVRVHGNKFALPV